MDFLQIKELDAVSGMQNYSRFQVAFDHGKGVYLYDTEGKEYLDFASGIGVAAIGYGNPKWVEAVSKQASKLAHVSNLFYMEPYAVLSNRLTALSGMKAVIYGNCGAEVNEVAIKIARKYSDDKYGKGRTTIITLLGSFHGRTMAALSATGQPPYHQHFYPFVEGFRYIAPNDLQALKDAITEDVCAIMVEGVQGEGGVVPLDKAYVQEMAKLAAEKDILLIFDEVQTGNGRTGDMFSYQGFDIMPDIMTTAKGLGGGLPIGVALTNDKCKDILSPGTHGSTYAGNPVCCAGAKVVLDVITQPGFLDQVKKKGEKIKTAIESWESKEIKEVRGKGLMLGLRLEGITPKKAVTDLLERGLVVLTAGQDVLRLLPPLTISEEEIDQGLDILHKYFCK